MKHKLFTSFTFPHGATMKNHFALAPMTTYSSNEDLTLSSEEEAYYNSRAKEFGMIITAATAVSKNAQAFEHQISIRDERYLDSMKRLASAITKEGSLAVIQLHHGGRMNKPGLYPNQDIVSASPIKANRDYAVTPRKLRISEVYDVIDEFVNASILAMKAGFDGVELHGANTYLIQQFFSPHSNRRDDEFGGNLRRRLTFPLTLVDRVIEAKKKYGKPDFIIGYRLSPEEREEPGITLEDTLKLVDKLSAKDIDYIHLSQGNYKNTSMRNADDKRIIAQAVSEIIAGRVTLIGAGGIDDVPTAVDALSTGYDLVALGTVALADPFIISHFEQGIDASKIIGEESLLPSPLLNRLRQWKGIEQKGYVLK